MNNSEIYLHTEYYRTGNNSSLNSVSSRLLNNLKNYAARRNFVIKSHQIVTTHEPALTTRDRLTLTAELIQA